MRPYGPGKFKNDDQRRAVMARLNLKGNIGPANYIGSKRKYLQFTIRNTPANVRTVYDGFSGCGIVGYAYKKLGYKVIANDHSDYAYHAARAYIENDAVQLTDEEIEKLLKPNPSRSRFIEKTYHGIYFTDKDLGDIAAIRSNIDKHKLKGYKRDIALVALAKACLSMREAHAFAYAKVIKDKGGGAA